MYNCARSPDQPDEIGGDVRDPLGPPFRPAIFDGDGAAIDPAEVAQPLHKGGRPLTPGSGVRAQEADGRQPAGLL